MYLFVSPIHKFGVVLMLLAFSSACIPSIDGAVRDPSPHDQIPLPQATAYGIPTIETPTIALAPVETPIPPPASKATASSTEALVPIVFDGAGDAFIEVNKWQGPALIRIDFRGPGNFNAWNLGNEEILLFFVIGADGPYEGTKRLDSGNPHHQTKYLEIYSDGEWTIEILPYEYCRMEVIPGTFKGTDDDVICLDNPVDSHMTVSLTGAYFAATVYALGESVYLLVQGESPLEDEVILPAGVELLAIEARGDWTITISSETEN